MVIIIALYTRMVVELLLLHVNAVIESSIISIFAIVQYNRESIASFALYLYSTVQYCGLRFLFLFAVLSTVASFPTRPPLQKTDDHEHTCSHHNILLL